jgi:hypothetical protein
VSTSNVRSIECLASFKTGLVKLASDWDSATQEIRAATHRINNYFQDERPAYWRQETQLAERRLSEARDVLSRLTAEIRPGDAAPATEAKQRVAKAKRRLQLCQEKERVAKAWAIKISQHCDELLGPLADMTEHCQTLLPEAARELGAIVDKLLAYAELSLSEMPPAADRDST